MKIKITIFHLLVVLTMLISVAVVVWALAVGQRLRTLNSTESIFNQSVATDDGDSDDYWPAVADSSQLVEEKIDMSGIDFDFSQYSNINAAADKDSPINYVNLPGSVVDLIAWTTPKKINKLGFFGEDVDKGINSTSSASYISTDYYLGGLFSLGNKPGAVIYADITCIYEMGCTDEPISIFILYDGQIIFLPKHQVKSEDSRWGNYQLNLVDYIDRARVTVDEDLFLPYLNYPLEIKHPAQGWVFKYSGVEIIDSAYKIDVFKKIYTDSVWGDFYMTTNSRPAVYSLGRDFRVREYSYVPEIADKDGLIDVVYDDSGKTITGYRYTRFGGCGEPAIHIIFEDKDAAPIDLRVVGKTTGGVLVYGLKDNNHKLLRDFYDGIFYPGAEGNISYEEFIAARPAVFWRDSFGQLIMFELNKFTPSAECGKPVIYLYPTKTTKVKVQLALSKLTVSEPEYSNGWEVMATPNGELTEIKSGAKYPYLFWEGLGAGEAESITAGFNVKKENVSKFLDEKLAAQGLNQKEIFDFKEFWLPKMQSAPYYFVTFYGTSDMNKIAPLAVSPKPDTVIRVLMDYRAVSAPLDRPEQKLSALPRKGFTVIEWGGVLYK